MKSENELLIELVETYQRHLQLSDNPFLTEIRQLVIDTDLIMFWMLTQKRGYEK